MRNILIITALCVVVIALGSWFYFGSVTGHSLNTGQQATTPAQAGSETPPAAPVQFSVLTSGTQAVQGSTRKSYAIYDKTEFARFWAMAEGADGKKVPAVDFSKQYVIAVFLGAEPTGGYAIGIDTITETGDARNVVVSITEPGKGCVVTQAKTSPYQFVTVPIGDALPLAHTDVRTVTECP